jgi:hypothetical protein
MGNIEAWTALAARIRGLIDASHLAAELFTKSNDSLGVMVDLGNHASAILSDLLAFSKSLDESEKDAKAAIHRVASKIGPILMDHNSTSDMRQIYVRTSIVALAALEGEISYLLRDSQESIRSRVERAFEHLNRLIVVDDDVREKWGAAYGKNEVACEKLGAVQLLSHGIWAFKVDAIKGRTDLVYQEPLDIAGVKRAGEGLVLTEWKKHSGGDDPGNLFKAARDQAQRYAEGVLRGTELTHYRYAVLVSQHEIKVPGDFQEGQVVYRHINIAVEPRTPSRQ